VSCCRLVPGGSGAFVFSESNGALSTKPMSPCGGTSGRYRVPAVDYQSALHLLSSQQLLTNLLLPLFLFSRALIRLLMFSVRVDCRWLSAVDMSDVPPTTYKLECAICADWKTTSLAGLRRHLISQHQQLRVHVPIAGTQQGQARRRAKVLCARLAASAVHDNAIGHVGGGAAANNDEGAQGGGEAHHGGAAGIVGAPLSPKQTASSPPTSTGKAAAGLKEIMSTGPAVAAVRATVMDGRGSHAQLQRNVQAEIDALMGCALMTSSESSSTEDPCLVAARPSTRRKTKRGSQAEVGLADTFVAARVRALYKRLADWKRVQPLVKPRAHSKVGQFNTVRLRALLEFLLSVGGAGLSRDEQRRLYELLEIWDGTKDGMREDDADGVPLTDTFSTPTSFVNAVRDDIDAAVNEAGWLKCKMSEGGQSYTGFFTHVPEAALDLMASSKKVHYWSGVNGPAAATEKRESPLDGDAFRQCEAEIVRQFGPGTFALGLHMYSDSTQLSWSGGKLRVVHCWG